MITRNGQTYSGKGTPSPEYIAELQKADATAQATQPQREGRVLGASTGLPSTTSPKAPQPMNAPNIYTPQVAGDAVGNAYNKYTSLLSKAPSSYDMYTKELESRGINTLIKQESQLGQAALEQEKALRPLLPENVAFKFPNSMKQLQEIGVNQDQLNLLAAKERAPIAQGLADLLKSQSIIAQQIDRQTQLAQHVTGLKQQDYENQVQAAKLQYEFAKEVQEGTALTQKEARIFAIENGIQSPFYNIGGTVYQTSDGYAFKSEEDFMQRTGKPVSEIQAQGLIQPVTGAAVEPATADIAEYEYAKSTGYTGTFQQWVDRSSQYKGGGGGGGGQTSPDVESWAQAVFDGTQKLTSVPSALRSAVNSRVQQMKTEIVDNYETDFDARLDYDSDKRALQQQVAAGGEGLPAPSQIISDFTRQYGAKISKQEIEAAIFEILGVPQRPTSSGGTAQPSESKQIIDRFSGGGWTPPM